MGTTNVSPDDTSMAYLAPDTHYGSSTVLYVGSQNSNPSNVQRIIMHFDLSGVSGLVTSATLKMKIYLDYADNTRTLRAYVVKRVYAWSSGLTWNNYYTSQAWQVGGCDGTNDRETTDCGSVSIAHNTATGTTISLPLSTSVVQSALGGTLRLCLRMDTENADMWAFYSNDYSVPGDRPVLEIVTADVVWRPIVMVVE